MVHGIENDTTMKNTKSIISNFRSHLEPSSPIELKVGAATTPSVGMFSKLPHKHGICSVSLYASFLTISLLHFLQPAESLSLLQQHSSISNPRIKRTANDSSVGVYHECNADDASTYPYCVCLGCNGEFHQEKEREVGSEIFCCYNVIGDKRGDNSVWITVLDSQYDLYTQEFERQLKESVAEGILEFCQDELHEDRCSDIVLDTINSSGVHVFNIHSQPGYGSHVLGIQFKVTATKNLSRRKRRRLPSYSSILNTGSNANVPRYLAASSVKALPMGLFDDAVRSAHEPHHRSKRAGEVTTIRRDIIVEATEAHQQIIEDRLQVEIIIHTKPLNVKSGWAGLSKAVRYTIIFLPIAIIVLLGSGFALYKIEK